MIHVANKYGRRLLGTFKSQKEASLVFSLPYSTLVKKKWINNTKEIDNLLLFQVDYGAFNMNESMIVESTIADGSIKKEVIEPTEVLIKENKPEIDKEIVDDVSLF